VSPTEAGTVEGPAGTTIRPTKIEMFVGSSELVNTTAAKLLYCWKHFRLTLRAGSHMYQSP
jgi:hypothetical protein